MNATTSSLQPVTLKLTPRRPALVAGYDNTVDLLVQVQGPDTPPLDHQKPQLNLAFVLDRSGSMDGPPLQEAIRCIRRMVERLNPQDRAALVVYDDRVQTLVPNGLLRDNVQRFSVLNEIQSGGCTDLHGGWLQGVREVAPYVKSDTVSRVLLLSDGQANRGLTEMSEINAQCAELAAAQVTTSTYGLGFHFNEDLMDGMAKAGQGNAYYGETADDLMDPFQREFDLLDALCAKQLRLRLEPLAGIEAAVLNLYAKEQETTILPDLAYGSEAWAVIRLKIPAHLSGQGEGGSCYCLRVEVSAQTLDGNAMVLPASIELPSLPVQAFNSISENELVALRVSEVEAADIQEQAQQAARRGDWKQVRRLMRDVRKRAKDNPWLGKIVDKLEKLAEQEDTERFAKESLFSSRALYSRIASKDEGALYDADIEAAKPSFLRRKKEQGKDQS